MWPSARKWALSAKATQVEQAVANLKEATELYLEEFPPENSGRPLVTVFEARYA
jgi:predicted RNase H-like HicB family nuclease